MSADDIFMKNFINVKMKFLVFLGKFKDDFRYQWDRKITFLKVLLSRDQLKENSPIDFRNKIAQSFWLFEW